MAFLIIKNNFEFDNKHCKYSKHSYTVQNIIIINNFLTLTLCLMVSQSTQRSSQTLTSEKWSTVKYVQPMFAVIHSQRQFLWDWL